MLRHLAASWLFAGFLVVVAVATWRVLDARTPEPAAASAVAAPVVVAVAHLPDVVETPPPPATPPEPTREVSSCGAAHDPFAPPDLESHRLTPLQFGSQPFADLTIDGKAYGSTPFYGPRTLTVAVGVHEIELRDKSDNKRYRYRLDVTAVDPENKVIVVLRDGSSHQPRTTGHVTMMALDMSERQAQQVFSDAVDALRDRRTAHGCDLLESIIDRTPSAYRWHEKSENLYSRRCD